MMTDATTRREEAAPELPEGEVEGLSPGMRNTLAELDTLEKAHEEIGDLYRQHAEDEAALAHQQGEIAAYRKAYGCIACGEDHPEGTMCPPFEVRTTGMSWNRGRPTPHPTKRGRQMADGYITLQRGGGQKVLLEYWKPSLIRRMARILGPSSAASKALADYEARREAGQDVHIFQEGSALVVGPCPTSALQQLGIEVEIAPTPQRQAGGVKAK